MRVPMVEFPRKARDNTYPESIPHDCKAWVNRPAIVEQAYRRGFEHGAGFAFDAVDYGCSDDDLRKWYLAVHDWRWQEEMVCAVPPEEPRAKAADVPLRSIMEPCNQAKTNEIYYELAYCQTCRMNGRHRSHPDCERGCSGSMGQRCG